MSLPAGPSQTPSEQNFHWFSRPYAYLEECEQIFGDVFTLNFQALGPHVFFSKPDWIKAVFSGDPNLFLGGQGKELLRPFLGDHSLLLSDGAPYQQHRKAMLSLLRSPQSEAWVDSLPQLVGESFPTFEKEMGVHDFLLEISLHSILRAIFGKTNVVGELASVTLELMQGVNFNPVAAGGTGGLAMERLQSHLSHMDELIFAEIKRQRKEPEVGSLLSQMVQGDFSSWSPQEIRDEVMTLLIAGHETTATSLAWILYELAQNPKVTGRLIEELAKDLRPPFLEAVIKEGLRLWPVIPVVARKLAAEFSFEGWTFPAGTFLLPCLYLSHRRADLFDRPKEFLPDRFLNRNYSPYEYYPFGGGVRRCLGMGMAMAEMGQILAGLFRDFTVSFSGWEKVRPSRRSVAIIPSGPFRIHLLPRS